MSDSIKCYRYKLRVTPTQESALTASMERHRWLYNNALRERLDLLKESKRTSFLEQRKALTALRAEREDWRAENYGVCGGTLRRLDEAWRRFEKTWRALSASDKGVRPEEASLPHFLRFGELLTLTWDSNGPKYQPANPDAAPGEPKNHRVYLPPFGWFRMFGDRAIPDGWVIRTGVEVSRRPDGWYVMLPIMDAGEASERLEATRHEREERNLRKAAVESETVPEEAPPLPRPKYVKKTPEQLERERWQGVIAALGGPEAARSMIEQSGALSVEQSGALSASVVGVSLGMTGDTFAATSEGRAFPLPPFGERAAGRLAESQRDIQRRREASREAALPHITEIERDESLTHEEWDRLIRIAKKQVSQGTQTAQRDMQRLALHVSNQRKREHYRIAHQILTGIPVGSVLAVAELKVKARVRVKAARPDAESPAYLPNGQAKRREQNRRVMGNAPGSFLLLLEQEAKEVGVHVVRLPSSAAAGGLETANTSDAATRLKKTAESSILRYLPAL